jgi:hypothetical protein
MFNFYFGKFQSIIKYYLLDNLENLKGICNIADSFTSRKKYNKKYKIFISGQKNILF